mgnify:FL=1|tara:strand:+ start:2323 stop:2514 length:192 start_codon:yes stop_codon:yes gene_type:complete
MKIGDLVYVSDEAIVPSGTTLHGFPALVVSIPNEEDIIVMADGLKLLVSRQDCRIYGEEVTNG